MPNKVILVSACLLGLNTRYSGQTKFNAKVASYLAQAGLIPIPVCPEQLAGLSTPRPATEFQRGDGLDVLKGSGQVLNRLGNDVTELFRKGATETLKIAKLTGCQAAILKERSPSCGVNWIYRQGARIAGSGVTAACLRQHHLNIFSEEELPTP
jgi:uncharacterized protein YbbK (DUF523 family)